MDKIIYYITRVLFALALMTTTFAANAQLSKDVYYLDTPTLYEGRHSVSFKVFQSFNDCALASEESSYGYSGKTVLIVGNFYYDGQIVKMKAPMQIGIYRYESKGAGIKTVPVVQQLITNNVVDTDKKVRRRSRRNSEE